MKSSVEVAISATDLFTAAMERLALNLSRAFEALLLAPRPVTDAEWATDWFRAPEQAWWEQ